MQLHGWVVLALWSITVAGMFVLALLFPDTKRTLHLACILQHTTQRHYVFQTGFITSRGPFATPLPPLWRVLGEALVSLPSDALRAAK